MNDLPVENFFMLELSPKVRRLCKVQWRSGDRLGASFVEVGSKRGGKSGRGKLAQPGLSAEDFINV